MAKKSNAVLIPAPFTVTTKANVKVFVGLNDSFKKDLLNAATEVGGFIQTAAAKIQIAINLVMAYLAFKDITPKAGLPKFVHDFVDSSCPEGYGKVGSADRKKIEQHKVFNGIDYLFRKGKLALDKLNERKALQAAGINPNDADKVAEHNKNARDEKSAAFEKAFCKCIVDFDKHGITDTTIGNLLISVLRKKEKGTDELNKAGTKLLNEAVKAVLRSRGVAVQETMKSALTQHSIMEDLKKAVENKDNVKAAKIAKNKK